MANNPLIQTWEQGILNKSAKETKIPTINTDEEVNGNKLQQYYNYYNLIDATIPLDQSLNDRGIAFPGLFAGVDFSQRLIRLTQVYTESSELLPYTNVFRNSDQCHDFYTDGRNVRGSFTYPTAPNSFDLTSYSKYTANTTFGGGSSIVALLFMPESTQQQLNLSDNISGAEINRLLHDNIGSKPLTNADGFNSTTDGYVFNTSAPGGGGGVPSAYCLLPLSMKGYDAGMHKLTEFVEPYSLYAVAYDKDNDIFDGYILYKSELKVPEQTFNILTFQRHLEADITSGNPMLQNTIGILNANTFVTTVSKVGKLRKIYEREDQANNNTIETELYAYFSSKYAVAPPMRGEKMFFQDAKTTDNNIEFLLLVVMKKMYQHLSPEVSTDFRSLMDEKQTIIKDHLQTPATFATLTVPLFKYTAFTTDTNTGPRERDIIRYYRGNLAETFPFRFTIVSNAVDGSGQGGQIFPSYHPPDIDVYMHIFDKDNVYRGSIFRFTFLSNIISNSLNSKSNVFVELHYCFFEYNDFKTGTANGNVVPQVYGFEIDRVAEVVDNIMKNILCNTKVERNAELLKLTTVTTKGIVKEWVFNKIDNAPSVEEANKATVPTTFVNKINKIKKQLGMDIPNTATTGSTAASVFNSLFSCICSKTIDIIDKFITAAIVLFNDANNVSILTECFDFSLVPDIFTAEQNFSKIFLLRNKFIGDKSRATDALFMNKNPIYECVQSSNDDNTLSSALMYNLSAQLLAAGSTNKTFYFAPYLTEANNPLYLSYPNAVAPTAVAASASGNAPPLSPATAAPGNAPPLSPATAAAPFSPATAPPVTAAPTQLTTMMTTLRNSLFDTKAPKKISTAKKNIDDTSSIIITGSRYNRNRNYMNPTRGGRVVPPNKSPTSVGSREEEREDEDTILMDDKKKKEQEEREEEQEEESVEEPTAVIGQGVIGEGIKTISENTTISLQNTLDIMTYIRDKYITPETIELTQDNLFIFMVLDRILYLLQNTYTTPYTIDSFIELLQDYLQNDVKMMDTYHYFITFFRSVLDLFHETYMLDTYGVEFCYTKILFDDESIKEAEEEGGKEEEEEEGEEKVGEEKVGEEKVGEEKEQIFEQKGGAVDEINLKIIRNYYINNVNDITYRITEFNKWDDSIQTEGLSRDFYTSVQQFREKNAEVFGMISDVNTYLDSVDYNIILQRQSEVGINKDTAISGYVSIAFFLIKLCTDFRDYLSKVFSFYFKRVNYLRSNKKKVGDIPDDALKYVTVDRPYAGEIMSAIDYENLFVKRYYYTDIIEDPGISSLYSSNNTWWRSQIKQINIMEEVATPSSSFNLVFSENILNEIVSFEPDGFITLSEIKNMQDSVLVELPGSYRINTKGDKRSLDFLDVNSIMRKIEEKLSAAKNIVGNNQTLKKNLPKQGFFSSETAKVLNRRTLHYLQGIVSGLTFLIKHHVETATDTGEYMDFMIRSFFTNITQGLSYDNYFGNNVQYLVTIPPDGRNYTIKLTTKDKKSSTITANYNDAEESYDLVYDKMLLKQVLDYIYDKCLFYLILTEEQKLNFYTVDSKNLDVNTALLNELSHQINAYFKHDNILNILHDPLNIQNIPEPRSVHIAYLEGTMILVKKSNHLNRAVVASAVALGGLLTLYFTYPKLFRTGSVAEQGEELGGGERRTRRRKRRYATYTIRK